MCLVAKGTKNKFTYSNRDGNLHFEGEGVYDNWFLVGKKWRKTKNTTRRKRNKYNFLQVFWNLILKANFGEKNKLGERITVLQKSEMP